jgi:phage gpG-like protein
MANFSITFDDKEVRAAFSDMQKAVKNFNKPLRDIAKHMKASIKENFKFGGRISQAGSIMGGSGKWQPLKNQRLTKSGNVSAKQSPLLNKATLQGSIFSRVEGNSVVLGSGLKHAAIHNFGGKTKPHDISAKHASALRFFKGKKDPVFVKTNKKPVKHPGSVIPARPFLVIQPGDMEWIKDRLLAHITGDSK